MELQVLEHCVKHAINNLMGCAFLDVDELDAIARRLAATVLQYPRGGGEPFLTKWYDACDGAYSIKVAQTALEKRGYTLRRVHDTPYADLATVTSGKFVVCIAYGTRDARGNWMTHAIGLDCDNCRILDSHSKAPIPATVRNYRAKTMPNATYPGTRINRVYRLVQLPTAPARPVAPASAPASAPVHTAARRRRRRSRSRAPAATLGTAAPHI